MITIEHKAVLCRPAIDLLVTDSEGLYLDATFGLGGHCREMLGRLSTTARVIALDRDPEAIRYGREYFFDEPRLQLYHSSFAQVASILEQQALNGVTGVLVDLGVSSLQLDQAERGFSFTRDGPLDMRMNQGEGSPASEWLARVTMSELRQVLSHYGEERFAARIARAIVACYPDRPLQTTRQLADLVVSVVPLSRRGAKHPATRTFQAIRIFINKELDQLTRLLEVLVNSVKVGGRIVIISFHSLEDRIVKQFFRKLSIGQPLPKRLPVRGYMIDPHWQQLGRAVRPNDEELRSNPRCRSAVMRAIKKLS